MSAFRPIADIGAWQTSSLAMTIINTDALLHLALDASEAGNLNLARQCYERGAALGGTACLNALGYMHHYGEGVPEDRNMAMKLYRRAWRRGSHHAAFSIAALYREQGKFGSMFRWFKRVSMAGDDSAQLVMAKCYLDGTGVRQDALAAVRCLAIAVRSSYITEEEREGAQALLDTLRPRKV